LPIRFTDWLRANPNWIIDMIVDSHCRVARRRFMQGAEADYAAVKQKHLCDLETKLTALGAPQDVVQYELAHFRQMAEREITRALTTLRRDMFGGAVPLARRCLAFFSRGGGFQFFWRDEKTGGAVSLA
jgi:hypothetical protein